MQLSTILFAAFLGLGANAAAVPEAEAMEANSIRMGDKHYGRCLVKENQCVIVEKHGERRINCRRQTYGTGAGEDIYPKVELTHSAAVASACTLPTEPISNNITTGFGIQVQNPAAPIVHNRYMNLWSAGGGDQHLYLSPAGDAAFNLTLDNGVISRGIIHAVINGEYTADDNTTKLFMTQRGDPKAFFQPTYGCNAETDAVQVELDFISRAALPGGFICVRSASGDRHEFRYSPPGNTAVREDRPCYEVTLALVEAPTS
ncbi:hypothetical protein CkaCkLH20_11906 [Colletotrichum karsti]|uniref:DUF7909 domain-containing protein n=1 Tax=Colletotrichum karsti TaxID=1095194 RepID=A0A9P6LFI3_9PEZI|nr:uncharacterized protein CkaCkLH20_11906 [Colletotrichum karsti]KAF9870600.1 hypothetical protein CkaCkLH20_11906 [Colletotrichum karsti]